MENIFGKNAEGQRLGLEARESAEGWLKTAQKTGAIELPTELQKSPEELAFVQEINLLLKEELEELGIENVRAIDPRQIHLVQQEDFVAFGNPEGRGFMDPSSGHVYINNETKRGIIKSSPIQEFALLLHESLHALSYAKYYVDEGERTILPYRLGYSNVSTDDVEERHSHFKGLNEAVTEAMASEILKKYKERISKDLALTEEDWYRGKAYEAEQDILSLIITKVAEKKQERPEEVWKRIKKAMFTGELMHLRDIEATFGKGSLRVVAAIDSGTIVEEEGRRHDTSYRDAVNRKIFEYLQSDDPEFKTKVVDRILNERERKGVAKRQS